MALTVDQIQTAHPTPAPPPVPARVIVTAVDIPFGKLVMLLVKLALAAIPAGAIVAFLYAMALAAFVAATHH